MFLSELSLSPQYTTSEGRLRTFPQSLSYNWCCREIRTHSSWTLRADTAISHRRRMLPPEEEEEAAGLHGNPGAPDSAPTSHPIIGSPSDFTSTSMPVAGSSPTQESVSPASRSLSPSHMSTSSNRHSPSPAREAVSPTHKAIGSSHHDLDITRKLEGSSSQSSTHKLMSTETYPVNITQHSANSTYSPLSFTPQTLGSTLRSLRSTSQSLSSTPQSLSSSSRPLGSTPQSLNSARFKPQSIHQHVISPLRSSNLIHGSSKTDSNGLPLIPQSLSTSQRALRSTLKPLDPPDMLNSSSPSLLLTLELVSTAQVPSLATQKSSLQDLNRITLNTTQFVLSTVQSVPKPLNLQRESPDAQMLVSTAQSLQKEPQEGFTMNPGLTSGTSPLTSIRRQHQRNLSPTPSSDLHTASTNTASTDTASTNTATTITTTFTAHRPTHRTRNTSKPRPTKRRSAKAPSNPMTRPAKPEAQIAYNPQKDVCSNDPCGKGVSCHPTPQGNLPYVCLCSNGQQPSRNETCKDIHVSTSPEPRAVFPTQLPKSKNLIGPAVVASVVLMVLLLLVYWRRKNLYSLLKQRQREKKAGPSPGTLAKSSSLLTYNFASNPNYYAQSPDALPLHTLAVQLINAEQIAFIGELGEGCFGKVYKGTYGPRCPEDAGGETTNLTVAVKVLKESAGMEAEADFLREVEIMSSFRHENILSLIGIVATETGGTPWMVFEYMAYGDLAEVLRSCNKQFYSNESPIKSLSKEDLLNMSVQIASGMEYLSSQHFVHRDLACRNCLVGDNLTVKISDFGMSRDVYTCDYYKVGGSRMLPVRWMAHESIMYGKFTLESDVWSFGVVLWEIYSFGKQPYYGNSNENVVKLIFQGILLSPPDTCPPQVCDVMRRCWATDPNDRLKFPEILNRLQRLQQGWKGSAASPVPASGTQAPPVPITYSELCLHDEGGLELDSDQYLMPRKVEQREYITILNDV
ncbi:uncharacterized protein [Cherax quadricarinatus]